VDAEGLDLVVEALEVVPAGAEPAAPATGVPAGVGAR
jgi:hypothetical protein